MYDFSAIHRCMNYISDVFTALFFLNFSFFVMIAKRQPLPGISTMCLDNSLPLLLLLMVFYSEGKLLRFFFNFFTKGIHRILHSSTVIEIFNCCSGSHSCLHNISTMSKVTWLLTSNYFTVSITNDIKEHE